MEHLFMNLKCVWKHILYKIETLQLRSTYEILKKCLRNYKKKKVELFIVKILLKINCILQADITVTTVAVSITFMVKVC